MIIIEAVLRAVLKHIQLEWDTNRESIGACLTNLDIDCWWGRVVHEKVFGIVLFGFVFAFDLNDSYLAEILNCI